MHHNHEIYYDQGKSGLCTLYAFAAGIGRTMWHYPTEEEIRAYAKKHDKGVEGFKTNELADIMMEHPLAGFKVERIKSIYRAGIKDSKVLNQQKRYLMANLMKAKRENMAIIMGMYMRKKRPKILLTEDNRELVIPEEGREEPHNRLLTDFKFGAMRRIEGIYCKNSWGKDWAKESYSFIHRDDLPLIADTIYLVKFAKAHA